MSRSDDLVITAVNEQAIPVPVPDDGWLTARHRSLLGWDEEARWLRRDRYLMEVATRSRRRVALLATSEDAEQGARLPSRFLLEGDPPDAARRLQRFLAVANGKVPDLLLDASIPILDDEPAPSPAPHERALDPEDLRPDDLRPDDLCGDDLLARFGFVVPEPPARPIERLPVTHLRDYLACPYRYYLKHVLRLRSATDRVADLGANIVGSLGHAVLMGRNFSGHVKPSKPTFSHLRTRLFAPSAPIR
jgi:hypothetical protein